MTFPIASRISVGLGIPLWAICLSIVWGLDLLSAIAFVAYSCYTGTRFLLYQTLEADKRSCKYYSVSVFSLYPRPVALILPQSFG